MNGTILRLSRFRQTLLITPRLLLLLGAESLPTRRATGHYPLSFFPLTFSRDDAAIGCQSALFDFTLKSGPDISTILHISCKRERIRLPIRSPSVCSRCDSLAAASRLGAAFASGLSAGGILACGKHFPGHGDTTTDSHLELPRVEQTRQSDPLPLATRERHP